MVHRKGIIQCSCANTLYSASYAVKKYNLVRFSTNFKFEDFFWVLSGATENAVAGHTQSAGLQLDHTGLIKLRLCSLIFTHCVVCYVCRLVEMYIRFSSDFWVSKCKAVFALASFHYSSAKFLSLRGVLTLVSCPIVVLTGLLLIAWKSFARVSNFRVFSPLLMFWAWLL